MGGWLFYRAVDATPGHFKMDRHKDHTMRMGLRCCWGSSSRVATWRSGMWMRWDRGEQCKLGGPGCYVLRDGTSRARGARDVPPVCALPAAA